MKTLFVSKVFLFKNNWQIEFQKKSFIFLKRFFEVKTLVSGKSIFNFLLRLVENVFRLKLKCFLECCSAMVNASSQLEIFFPTKKTVEENFVKGCCCCCGLKDGSNEWFSVILNYLELHCNFLEQFFLRFELMIVRST